METNIQKSKTRNIEGEEDSLSSNEIEESQGNESATRDNQSELKKFEKLDQEKKKFLKELQKSQQGEAPGGTNSAERLKIMLDQAEIFANFLLKRGSAHDEKDIQAQKEEVLQNEKDQVTRLTVQPTCLKGGELKDYQLNGLNWLISLHENGINGILADEMGLGKTIQTISFVAFLREFKKVNGPHLVIGPNSTLGNWFREFQKWLPSANVLKVVGTKEEIEEIITNRLKPGNFDICIVNYEGINKYKSQLAKFNWKSIIIDEASKIKNEESALSRNLRDLKTNFKLLLTGTPLQNNLHELWSLLNFLLPDLFASSELFDIWFEMTSTAKAITGENVEFIKKLRKILKPFLLRRTKSEVEAHLPPKKEVHLFIGLSEMQVNLYKTVLSKKSVTDDTKFSLNILMQLRKVCNHPYLVDGVEDESLPALGDHLINASGKMIILDKLLEKLFKEGHQVLIFCQMTKMLDILEDYCHFRQYKYCRIDGSTDLSQRNSEMAEFTKPDSDKFVFLLSTRVGGLGLKLDTADTVILYDSDVNPQMDTLAIERAYTLYQQNPVTVYRMITENSVEEKILDLQLVKLKQDLLDTQQGQTPKQSQLSTIGQVEEIISYGGGEVLQMSDEMKDEDIYMILERNKKKTIERKKLLGIEDFEEEKEP